MLKPSLLLAVFNVLSVGFALSALASENQTSAANIQTTEHCNRYYRGYLWKVFSCEYYHGSPCTGFDDNAITFRIDEYQDNSDEMVQTAIKSAAEGLEVYVTFEGCKGAIVGLSNTPDPAITYIYK